MAEKAKFLRNIHYFRGIAIICIVFVHTWFSPSPIQDYSGAAFIDLVREVVFHDSTIYFLFISGFLFYYLSTDFQLADYYKKKIINVIFPYVVLTSLIIISNNIHLILNLEYSTLRTLIKRIILSLIYGKAKIQYWYIPFVAGIFLISPLLLRIPQRYFNKIALTAGLLPLLGTRTDTQISIYQYIYFFPVYLLGIFSAMNYDWFVSTIKKEKLPLCLIAILSTVTLGLMYHNNLHVRFDNISESIYYIQKLSTCFLMIVALQKYENLQIPLLDSFATYSFAIYFTHTIISSDHTQMLYSYYVLQRLPNLNLPLSLIYSASICLSTLLFCVVVKALLGKHSRYIIGA